MRTISRFLSTRRIVVVSLLLTILVSSLELQGNASAITEWAIPAGLAPKGIAVSSGGLVYFAEINEGLFGTNDQIGRLDPSSGEFAEWDLGSKLEPYGVAVDDSYVYFVESEGNRIGRLDTSSGELVRWTIPTSNSGTSWLSVFSSLVYFVEEDGNKIGRLNPDSDEFTEWTIPTPNSRPLSLAVNGNVVYFTEYNGNKIGRLDTSLAEFTEWTIPTSSSHPYSVALYDGLVYFTETSKIGSLDPSIGVFTEWNVGTDPSRMVAYDGILYFASQAHNSICRLGPFTGEFAEWTIPTSFSLPYDIAASSGSVYFTESGGHKIGRLDFSPVGSTTLTSSRTRSTFTTTSTVSTAEGTFISSTSQASSVRTTSSVTGRSETSSTQFSDTLTYFVDARPVIDSQWTNSPPSIDGIVQAGEWSNLVISFTSPEYPDSYVLPTYVYFMNDATNLYVLVDAVGDTTNEAGDECLLIFDSNSNPADGYVVVRVLQTGVGPITWSKSDSGFDAAIGYSGSAEHKVYEFSIPFAFIGVSPGDSFDFCSPFWKTGTAGGGSMPLDNSNKHDNVWPKILGTSSSWQSSIDGWGIVNSQQQPQRAPSNPPQHVGGELFTANKLAVLSPYLTLIGLVAVAAVVVKRKLT